MPGGGIEGKVDGIACLAGNARMMAERGVDVSASAESAARMADDGKTVLYFAYAGRLAGIIAVADVVKPTSADAIAELGRMGIDIVMLTGDNERTAARVAAEAGVTEFRADMLPEDKHGFVARLREEGRHVVMVGDGVNDAPALSLADVGIAMGQGTAIAKEVADITLTGGDLSSLVALRRLSQGLMDRLSGSFGQVMAINSALLAAGIAGVARPQVSSLLHNATTIALALRNSGKYNV